MLPCMDTPGVRATYEARVTVSKASGLSAVMSATRQPDAVGPGDAPDLRTFAFAQTVAVPSYLIALAVGNIVGKSIGPRTTVYAEPPVFMDAAREFADIEQIIKTGEEIVRTTAARLKTWFLPHALPSRFNNQRAAVVWG